ncbi:MAG: hypothetical protein ICV73_24685 [Acetobacteraceae bacterium]|nr:hypothetical protein [Acetobacteraceae bacterium]
MNAPTRGRAAGRVCPADYWYGPAALARPADFEAEALYVAGGLYGNLQALRAVSALAAAEPGARLALNGDHHWFDADPAWCAAVEEEARGHLRLRGNVETEIARGVTPETGCGCAYPDDVDETVVARSNAIIARLAEVVAGDAATRRALAALPMHLVAQVGPARVAIVHGDADTLAGWRFGRAALDDPHEEPWRARARAESRIDVFASTHTGAPALRVFGGGACAWAVANNGAAGLPNAAGGRFGIVTRVAVSPSRVPPLYGARVGGVFVEALRLDYDHAAFLDAFDACWPSASPAALAYRRRIVAGPDGTLERAAPARA